MTEPDDEIIATDFSLGGEHFESAYADFVEAQPLSADDYFALTDEEKRECPRDSRGLPIGYWLWSQEAWKRYGQENQRQERTGPKIPPNGEDKAPEKPPSRVTGAGTFMQSYVPISYTLGGILPSGYLYGLTAKQGSGKTAWKIAATIAVAMNRPDVIGCDVEPGRVAYVSIENPTDFKMKLAVNCYAYNISYDEIEPRVAIIDGRDTPEQIFQGLKLDAEKNGSFQLVCFDTFQAGFAAAGAGAFNDNEAVLNYVTRLRPLTMLPGSPSALVAFHPTKNAGEGELIPYGGGSTYNEIDGNLTLWKEAQIKLYHNRLRGPEFEPKYFRIEMLSCPDIVDKQGRQILLPVMRPSTEADAETREKSNADASRALLAAMIADPVGTQADWGVAINQSKGRVNGHLQRLEKERLVVNRLNKWVVTRKGIEAVS
jgi:AAA domain